MFYGEADIYKIVTKEVMSFIQKNQNYFIFCAEENEDYEIEIGCKSITNYNNYIKKQNLMFFSFIRLQNNNKNKDQYAIVIHSSYDIKNDDKIVKYFWLIDESKNRFTDDEKIYKEIKKKHIIRNHTDNTESFKKILTLTPKDKLFDAYAKKLYKIVKNGQFKGEKINCYRCNKYEYFSKELLYTYYRFDFVNKNGKVISVYYDGKVISNDKGNVHYIYR